MFIEINDNEFTRITSALYTAAVVCGQDGNTDDENECNELADKLQTMYHTQSSSVKDASQKISQKPSEQICYSE